MPPQLIMWTPAEVAGYLNHGRSDYFIADMEAMATEDAIRTLIPVKDFDTLMSFDSNLTLDLNGVPDVPVREIIEILKPDWPLLRSKLVAARWILDAPAECQDMTKVQCATLCARVSATAWLEFGWDRKASPRRATKAPPRQATKAPPRQATHLSGITDVDLRRMLPVRPDDDSGIASLMTAAGCPPDAEGRYVRKEAKARIKFRIRRPSRGDATSSSFFHATHSWADARKAGAYMLGHDSKGFAEIWNNTRECSAFHYLSESQKDEFGLNNLLAKESSDRFKRKEFLEKADSAKSKRQQTDEDRFKLLVATQKKRSSNQDLDDFCSLFLGRSDGYKYSTPRNSPRVKSLRYPAFQEALRIALEERDKARHYAVKFKAEELPDDWQGPLDLCETWSETREDIRSALRRLRQWYEIFFPKKRPNWKSIYLGQKPN